MTNIKLLIAYDGTRYTGWQRTGSGGSIQEALEAVLVQILQEPITLQAASRTDAGVHARGQTANFHTRRTTIDLRKLLASVNRLLPEEIAVRSAALAPESFHATLDCKEKEYHYTVNTHPILLPQERHYSWHYPYPLDLKKMQDAAKFFLGTHDFKSLCNRKKNEEYAHTVRHIARLEIEEPTPDNFLFTIRGAHFLYKMVRNIVGCLVYVGRGRIQPAELRGILEGKSREHPGMTAPALGLTLEATFY